MMIIIIRNNNYINDKNYDNSNNSNNDDDNYNDDDDTCYNDKSITEGGRQDKEEERERERERDDISYRTVQAIHIDRFFFLTCAPIFILKFCSLMIYFVHFLCSANQFLLFQLSFEWNFAVFTCYNFIPKHF